jgi:hypothetical protein
LALLERNRCGSGSWDAGGKVLGEPMEIPGIGLYVSFFDSEGNRVSMMQPNESWKSKAK